MRNRRIQSKNRTKFRRRRSMVETLEDRRLLTVWTVNDPGDRIADDGKVTLREAVDAAVNNISRREAKPAGSVDDVILFADSMRGQTITLTAPLVLDGVLTTGISANSGNADRNAGSITIIGPGMDQFTIDGSGVEHISTVEDTIKIVGMELKGRQKAAIITATRDCSCGGTTSSDNFQVQESYVTLDGVRITESGGSGIRHLEGTLEIYNSEIVGTPP